jgi:hypothetical protein
MRKRRDGNDHINVVAAELDSFAKSNRLAPYLLAEKLRRT